MRKCTIKVSKTIQEDQYEPFSISFETTFSVDENLSAKKRKDFIDKEYYELQEQVKDKIREVQNN